MNLTRKKAFSIAIIITSANIIGKLLGFAKDVLISYYYGASYLTDAIFLAMSIPLLINGVFTSSTDSAVIPQYTRISSLNGKETADKHFSNIVNSISFISFIVSLAFLVKPSIFIDIFAPGFNFYQRQYAEYFLCIFSFFGLMHILYCFFSTYNTIYSRILPRAVLTFSTNLLVVVSLLIFHDQKMVMLSVAFLIGNMLAGVIPSVSAVRNGYKHKFIFFKFDSETIKFIRIFLPIMGGALLTNLHMFVDKYLASMMVEGSISYINYASRLTSIFDSMIVVGIGVVILPLLSQNRLNNDLERFNRNATNMIKLLVILLLPIVILCMLVNSQIIEVIYMRGKFGTESLRIVSKIFLLYAPQILAMPLQALMIKIFHSVENTKTPFYISLLSIGLNIFLSIVFSVKFGLEGIAVATTISVIVSNFLLVYKMKTSIGWDIMVFGRKELLKISVCGALSGLIAFITMNYANQTLIKILIVGISGGITYLILFRLFFKDDFNYIKRFIIKK